VCRQFPAKAGTRFSAFTIPSNHGSTSRGDPASLSYCSDEEFNSTEANRGKMFNHPILATLGSAASYWTKVQYLNV
jgi:hypothetical protein